MRAPPLSYSSISTFQQCPHKFYRTRIAKDLPEQPPHPSAAWGSEVHAALEQYLRDGTPLPQQFSMFEPYAAELKRFAESRNGSMYIEHKLAVDDAFAPIEFDAPEVRYRGIVDYLVIDKDKAFLLDHKTGKLRPTDQLALNAILIFAHWSEVETVHAAFFWLAERTYSRYTYTRAQMPTLEQTVFAPVVKQIEEYLRIEAWPKRQSGLCRYCPVIDCEHNG